MPTGSCLCGTIRYQFDQPVSRIGLCHCQMCRKASGTAFAANAPVPRSEFRLLAGAEALKAYASSPGKQRWFCSNCGSPVYSESARYPDLVRIRLGSLDAPAGRLPDYHYLLSAKADWDTSGDDGLPRFGDD
ncbi:MAG: GFA family protein [Gammaproteobacteria bacterium]|nr:GFA family protein [Gammaproteobacteria bacterium]